MLTGSWERNRNLRFQQTSVLPGEGFFPLLAETTWGMQTLGGHSLDTRCPSLWMMLLHTVWDKSTGKPQLQPQKQIDTSIKLILSVQTQFGITRIRVGISQAHQLIVYSYNRTYVCLSQTPKLQGLCQRPWVSSKSSHKDLNKWIEKDIVITVISSVWPPFLLMGNLILRVGTCSRLWLAI